MKAKILKNAVIVLILAAMIHSCKEDEPTLPPETQTGAHTFGCYVNGELFVPQWGSAGFGTPILQAIFTVYDTLPDNILTICASGKNGYCIMDVLNPKEDHKKEFQRLDYLNYNNNNSYQGKYTGEIFLTRFDTINMIVSGTFSFTIPSVHATQGRFDIKGLRIFRF